MFPLGDSICILLETPLSTFKEKHRKEVLNMERPTPMLNVSKTVNNNGKPYRRKFKTVWYDQYQWLCGSYYLNKLFCWPCSLVSAKSSIWNKIGFDDFLNVTRALHKHEGSADHIRSAVGYKQLQRNVNTIADALQENYRLHVLKFNENVHLNRQFMKLPINVVLYLGKQELAFRGRDESSNRGNFEELLKMFVNTSPEHIQNHYKKIESLFSGDTKIVEDELISCISEYIEEYIGKELNEALFFSVQVDDTSDMVQKSQSSIILRYVNSAGTLVERFLGFYDAGADRSAEALFNLVHSSLERYNYSNSRLIAQCYDGASVISNHLNDLQTKVKEIVPQAVFVHCLAHRLDLVLQHSVNEISQCRIFFACINGLLSFFHHTAKKIDEYDSVIGRRISSASSNSKILNLLATEWNGLKEIFQQLIDDPLSDHKSIHQSEGFLNKFNDFEFTFLVLVFKEIFELTNTLFEVLQKNCMDITYCLSQTQSIYKQLLSKRNKNEYETIFGAASSKTTLMVQQGGEDQVFEHHKKLYYEILDTVIMQMDIRFRDMEKLQFVALVDSSKFDEYASHFPADNLKTLQQSYPNLFSDMDLNRLKNELQFVYGDQQYRGESLQDLIKLLHENRDIFKETYKLFCLVLTLPCISASVDSSPCLKRVKSSLQNSVPEERLSCLNRIAVEKELLMDLTTNQPFYEDIINKFAALENRTIDLTYKK